MLSLRVHRLAACFALAGYLLASVVLGSVHHHGLPASQAGCCDGGHDAGHAPACCHHHGHAHEHGATRPPETPAQHEEACPPLAPAHEECAVCRILSQAAVIVAIPVDEQRAPLWHCVPSTEPPAFVAGLPTTHFSRGPPAIPAA